MSEKISSVTSESFPRGKLREDFTQVLNGANGAGAAGGSLHP